MLHSPPTEHILNGQASITRQGSQSAIPPPSTPLSESQKKLICDEHNRQLVQGNSPTVQQLSDWAKKEFALPTPPAHVSISRLLHNAGQTPVTVDHSVPEQQHELPTPQPQPIKDTPMTAHQKNMIRQENTRIHQQGKKPTVLYLRQWAQQKFQLSNPPPSATVLRILANTPQPAFSCSQPTDISLPDNEDYGNVKVMRIRRMGLKYVTLSPAQKRQIQDETKRRVAAGLKPTYEQMAEWAKDNFNLEKLPSIQTISRLLQNAAIPKLRVGMSKKRRQLHRVVVDPKPLHPVDTPAPLIPRSVLFPSVNTANFAAVHPQQPLVVRPLPIVMASPLTTHALDTSTGRPAAGLELELYRRQDDGTEQLLCHAQCNANGRVADLMSRDQWKEGVYRLRFMTERYFMLTNTDCFYPYCDVTFSVRDTTSHYHVPLLISPFGFTTYRGS